MKTPSNPYFSAYMRQETPGLLMHWCPGCAKTHTLNVDNSRQGVAVYRWNGNPDNPSFDPAVLIVGDDGSCHYTIKNGNITFHQKSSHKLRMKTVMLPFFPES